MKDSTTKRRGKTGWNTPGMRRVRLLCWKLYYGTPLTVPIEEWVERGVARQCKLTWANYCALKGRYPELWDRWAAKRAKAVVAGQLPQQPAHLRAWRKGPMVRAMAQLRKPRPRFTDWAMKKLWEARRTCRPWLRERINDRLLAALVVDRQSRRGLATR